MKVENTRHKNSRNWPFTELGIDWKPKRTLNRIWRKGERRLVQTHKNRWVIYNAILSVKYFYWIRSKGKRIFYSKNIYGLNTSSLSFGIVIHLQIGQRIRISRKRLHSFIVLKLDGPRWKWMVGPGWKWTTSINWVQARSLSSLDYFCMHESDRLYVLYYILTSWKC